MLRYRFPTGIAMATSLALFPATAMTADSGGYLGGGIGYYRLNDDNFLDEDEDFKDDRWAWKAFAGIQFNAVLSVEGGYVDFGSPSDGALEIEADGWTVAALAHLPLTANFAPYGKVGQLFWDRERSTDISRRSDSGNDMFYAVGLRFDLADHVQMRMEYERFSLDDTDLDMGSLNLQYRF